MTQTAENMRKSVEEAKQADEQHTQLARSIMG
jgi:hypothetical protein